MPTDHDIFVKAPDDFSGSRKDGRDRLYNKSTLPVEIDADIAEEYWREIRGRL